MRICLITSVYALSETDRNGSFLVESVRYLRERGHDLVVLAPSYRGRKGHMVNGVRVHRFRYFPRRWEDLTHFEGAPNKIRNRLYLLIAGFYIVAGLAASIRLCGREEFDLVHVHWPFPHGIWGYAVSRLFRFPMVLTFHGAELALVSKFFFIKYFLRYAVCHASGIICNSTYTASRVAQLLSCQAEVIPFGTTVRPRSVKTDPDKLGKDILFVGRLIARKGVEYLLCAVPRIAEAVPCHVHIVGDGDRASELRSVVHEMRVEDLVTFHGVVPNDTLEDLYARADVFVLPAIIDDRGDTEGLGVVLVEALSFKTPVVATDVGGIPDVIINDQTGLLVPQKSPEAIADAVIKLLTDRARAERLADQGFRYACSHFDWSHIADRIESVYANAVGTYKSSSAAKLT